MEVSSQAYYQWKKRKLFREKRDLHNQRTASLIRIEFARSRQTYGSPRIAKELPGVNHKRIARIMRENQLVAKAARKFKATTDSRKTKFRAPDLVNRKFVAEAPNQLWVSDISYIPTLDGWLYLATVIDVFSRAVVGWNLDIRITADLVANAYERAFVKRRPSHNVTVHSDQGSQYGSDKVRAVLSKYNAHQSMGSVGDCYDNALAESFWHTLKTDIINHEPLISRQEMKYRLFDYIENFYNKQRTHSALKLVSPNNFEHNYYSQHHAA